MSVLDYILIAVIALCFIAVAVYLKKKKHKGCCGSCECCSQCNKHCK